MISQTTGKTLPVYRTDDLKFILRCLGKLHPHVEGQPPLRRLLERQRIAYALKSEAHALGAEMFYLRGVDGRPVAGAVSLLPQAEAVERFGAYGSAPAFFGFLFGFKSSETFSAVFAEVCKSALREGRQRVFGPVESTINHSIGLLDGTSGFPSSFLMPCNPPEWAQYFSDAGFSVSQRLFTYESSFADGAFYDFRKTPKADKRVLLRPLRTPFSSLEKETVANVFNSGWRENWGFVPLSASNVEELEHEFKPILWDGLGYTAWVGDAPAGIAIAVPDLNEISAEPTLLGELRGVSRLLFRKRSRSVKLLILGLAKPFQRTVLGLNVIEALIREIMQSAEQKFHATHLQMGWTLESNRAINHVIKRWAPKAARTVHSVWEKKL